MAKEIELTDSNFDNVINNEKLVLLDFWANWCGPCKTIAPIISELADQYNGNLTVCKVDVDDNYEIAMKYNIRSVPTLMIFKDGAVVEQFAGVVLKSYLEEKINSYL